MWFLWYYQQHLKISGYFRHGFANILVRATTTWDDSRDGHVSTLRPRRNEQHFADDIFKRIFFNENVWISIKISLKFVPKGPINNIPSLVQIMAWRRSGDKPLSEPMVVSLPTHICITRPQWVRRAVNLSAMSEWSQRNIGNLETGVKWVPFTIPKPMKISKRVKDERFWTASE